VKSAKPFDISKRLVWEAYKEVKANGGAAEVDEESIEGFEANLKDNLYSDMESDVFWELFSAAGQRGTDSEEQWWGSDVGYSDGFGSGGSDGGEEGFGADIGACV